MDYKPGQSIFVEVPRTGLPLNLVKPISLISPSLPPQSPLVAHKIVAPPDDDEEAESRDAVGHIYPSSSCRAPSSLTPKRLLLHVGWHRSCLRRTISRVALIASVVCFPETAFLFPMLSTRWCALEGGGTSHPPLTHHHHRHRHCHRHKNQNHKQQQQQQQQIKSTTMTTGHLFRGAA